VRLLAFHWTTLPGTKPVPFTVSVRDGFPAATDAGERPLMAGTGLLPGLLMVNDVPAEVPPPGAGFHTVTVAAPAEATSDAMMDAVNCVGLT
jgi:hypothetical protein